MVSHPLEADASSDGLSPTLVLRYCPLWVSCAILEAQVRGLQGSVDKSGLAQWQAWGGEPPFPHEVRAPSLSCLTEEVAVCISNSVWKRL